MDSIKMVTVGDGNVGKTCMLMVYTRNEFPEKYIPTIFENFTSNIFVDDEPHTLMLWDTAGQETYNKLRALSYPKTRCFLVCYSVVSRTSYENIETTWLPEISYYCPNTPFILIGMKTDLRIENSQDYVSTKEGNILKEKTGAFAFVECSAKENFNIYPIFEAAVRAALTWVPKKKPFRCQLF